MEGFKRLHLEHSADLVERALGCRVVSGAVGPAYAILRLDRPVSATPNQLSTLANQLEARSCQLEDGGRQLRVNRVLALTTEQVENVAGRVAKSGEGWMLLGLDGEATPLLARPGTVITVTGDPAGLLATIDIGLRTWGGRRTVDRQGDGVSISLNNEPVKSQAQAIFIEPGFYRLEWKDKVSDLFTLTG